MLWEIREQLAREHNARFRAGYEGPGLGVLDMAPSGMYLVGDTEGWCGFSLGPFNPDVKLNKTLIPDHYPADVWYGIEVPTLPFKILAEDISPIGPSYTRYTIYLGTWAAPYGKLNTYWRLGWDHYRKIWLVSNQHTW